MPKSSNAKSPAERVVKDIRRKTRRHFSAEDKIRIVLEGLYHEHANASGSEDACLFSFSDLPAIRALGLYREEALGENDGHQPVIS
jgi:gentisate 1,2-dioxygenase